MVCKLRVMQPTPGLAILEGEEADPSNLRVTVISSNQNVPLQTFLNYSRTQLGSASFDKPRTNESKNPLRSSWACRRIFALGDRLFRRAKDALYST